MQDGLNLTLMISSANLVAIAGVIVKLWLAKRPQKIEQPLEVRNAGSGYNADLCAQRHRDLEGQVTKLFAKVESSREDQAEVRGVLDSLKTQVASIDGKMDRLLSRK